MVAMVTTVAPGRWLCRLRDCHDGLFHVDVAAECNNRTTTQRDRGLFFSPTIPINRVSGAWQWRFWRRFEYFFGDDPGRKTVTGATARVIPQWRIRREGASGTGIPRAKRTPKPQEAFEAVEAMLTGPVAVKPWSMENALQAYCHAGSPTMGSGDRVVRACRMSLWFKEEDERTVRNCSR